MTREEAFVNELIGYIFAYPDDDYMTMECLCRKLHKHELIKRKDGEWTCNFIEQADTPKTETEIAKAIVHKMIDDSVIAEDAYPETEWIPCSERLPEEKEMVLTYDSIGHIDFGQYDRGQWYWLAEACADYWMRNDGVIAWMPLPMPYKGGE